MASQALFSRVIYDQFFDFPGMAPGRSMTVFTLYFFVPGITDRLEVIFVALGAAIPALVLDRKIFPLIDIAKAIEIVGKGVTVNAKILRDHEVPGDHNQQD